jgi:biopolymer transport protein ExbD
MRTLDRSQNGDDGPMANINIVPFVDVVLVMLIIFMLTSAAIVKASLGVTLPKAASGGSRVETTLNIVYTADNRLLLNGLPVIKKDLAPLVRAARRENPKVQAVISADRGVAYGGVVEVIDLVKQNGVISFALDVERVSGSAH